MEFCQIKGRTPHLGVCKQMQPALCLKFVKEDLQALFFRISNLHNLTPDHASLKKVNSLYCCGQGKVGLLNFGLLRLVHLRDLFGALFRGSLSLGGGALRGRFGRGRGVRDLFERLFCKSCPFVLCRRRSKIENSLLNLGGLLFKRSSRFWGFKQFMRGFTSGF